VKPKVYLETTIPSLLTAWPSRDLIIAADQQSTRDWWENRRQNFELFVSPEVLGEAGEGDPTAARLRLEVINTLPVLAATEAVEELTRAAQAERSPVELFVRQKAVVLLAAAAVESHTEDGRVRGAGELLDAPEGREQHLRFASYRTGERVAARERVVHADVVETTPDGHPPDSQYVISE